MDLLLPHLGLIVWTILAFLVVLFILKKYAWTAILKGLNDREANIANSIATADKVRAEMANLKSENEALLVAAREERGMMLKEAKEIKDKMINDAKDDAKVHAAKIITDAQASIQNQKMAALTDIKNEVTPAGPRADATMPGLRRARPAPQRGGRHGRRQTGRAGRRCRTVARFGAVARRRAAAPVPRLPASAARPAPQSWKKPGGWPAGARCAARPAAGGPIGPLAA